MQAERQARQPAGSRQDATAQRVPKRLALMVAALALVTAWVLYSPVASAPFVFDDSTLPFEHSIADAPVGDWVSGVRPLLMFTYWINRTLWGNSAGSYHAINILIHVLNTALVFLVLWRLLQFARWEPHRVKWAAIVGTFVFLIHPLQTEAVSYVAGRSESLCTLFMLLAYVVFLYRRDEAISWLETATVLVLFGAAILTKENAVSLAGILLLTDVSFPIPFSAAGIRKNWRLYALIAPAAVVAAVFILRMLATATSAGFSVRDFTWYQYAFTEARAIFTYIRLTFAPFGQSVDHDYSPSLTIFQHGAILWTLLLAALVFAAIRLRRRYPIACFGLFWFLIALAPTSSVIPIFDPLVERRMYLAIVGLILVGFELFQHIRLSRPAAWGMLTAGMLILGGLCYGRNQTWSDPEKLFADAAAQSTHNPRPYLNLTEVLVHKNRCEAAIPPLRRAEHLLPGSYPVQVAWGWTLQCLGQREQAMQRLQSAARIHPNSRVYEWIGLLYGEMNRSEDAGQALHKAVDLDPESVSAHKALALWYESVANVEAASAEYTRSLALDPRDREAKSALARLRQPPRSFQN
jgi:hypothetical protein